MHTGNPAALWNHTGTDWRKRPTKIKGHSVCFNFHFIFSMSNLHIRQRNAVYCGYKKKKKKEKWFGIAYHRMQANETRKD